MSDIKSIEEENAQLKADNAELAELLKEFLDYADPCHPISDKIKNLI
ncbi:hypothetical protein [Vibrio casei]